MSQPPYVIFALPRCRTKWLSVFLQYRDWQCGHEELRHCRSMHDVASWLAQPCTGTIETVAAPFWRLLPPGIRVVTIRRPIPEVLASLRRGGLQFDDAVMRHVIAHADAKLRQLAHRREGVMQIEYADLGHEETCARIFEHCLPYDHDHAWWEAAQAVNIQISLPHMMQYFVAHWPQVEKLRKIARHRCLAAMAKPPTDLDGMTFQCEEVRSFYRDARQLFEGHLVETDQSPDEYWHKNVALFETLYDHDALQIMTARCNGRMFGYLVTVIGPSLDDPNVRQGFHTIFYASPDARGLGMKLQRAAVEALRERGVLDVQMRAGHRGSGPRLGTLYRRLGAEEFGQLYRLQLAELER